MPRYLNRSIVSYNGGTVLPQNLITNSLDVAKTNAEVTSIIPETYDITAGLNDILLIKFNDDVVYTSITLTAGVGRTAAQIAADINAVFAGVASADDQLKVKIVAPVMANKHSSKIFIKHTGSTANATLGFIGYDSNTPISEGYIGLEELHPLPLYNPIINEEKITFVGAGSVTYDLYNPDRTKAIKLFRTTVNCSIAIQDSLNVPYLTVEANESVTLRIANRITKLVITAVGAGDITVRELINDQFIY